MEVRNPSGLSFRIDGPVYQAEVTIDNVSIPGFLVQADDFFSAERKALSIVIGPMAKLLSETESVSFDAAFMLCARRVVVRISYPFIDNRVSDSTDDPNAGWIF